MDAEGGEDVKTQPHARLKTHENASEDAMEDARRREDAHGDPGARRRTKTHEDAKTHAHRTRKTLHMRIKNICSQGAGCHNPSHGDAKSAPKTASQPARSAAVPP